MRLTDWLTAILTFIADIVFFLLNGDGRRKTDMKMLLRLQQDPVAKIVAEIM